MNSSIVGTARNGPEPTDKDYRKRMLPGKSTTAIRAYLNFPFLDDRFINMYEVFKFL